jgi:hypothetical protein
MNTVVVHNFSLPEPDQMLGTGINATNSDTKVKVAELDTRARAPSLTNVRSGPQSPESHEASARSTGVDNK